MMLRELTKLNRERMKTKRHAHVGASHWDARDGMPVWASQWDAPTILLVVSEEYAG